MGISLPPGTTLGGEYVVERPLSEGGMGSVFVARQASTNRARALKVLSPEIVADPKFHEGFLREARVGSLIPSEHVVEVIGAGIDRATGLPWIAMELLDGLELGEYVAKHGPMPWPQARKVLTELFHALQAAHGARIVHRDLKPGNVFLHRERRAGADFVVKVLDFGIAKILTTRSGASASMTRSIGTPGWMAPEQVKGAGVSAATDVWALGLIAFFVLVGRSFWVREDDPSGNVHALMYEMFFEPMPPASARAAQYGAAHVLPAGLDAWLARCLQRETPQRFQDASQAWQALEPILDATVRAAAAPVARAAPAAPLAADLAPTAPYAAPLPRTQADHGPPTPPAHSSGTVPPSSPPPAFGVAPVARAATAGAGWASGPRPTPGAPIATPPLPARGSSRKRVALVIAGAILGVAVIVGAAAGVISAVGSASSAAGPGATQPPAASSAMRAPSAVPEQPKASPGLVRLPAGTMEIAGIPVSVASVEVDAFEATVEGWDACAAAGKCTGSVDEVSLPGLKREEAAFWTSFCTHADRVQRKRHPLNCVSASQARDYCTSRGMRLPALAEWAYAAYRAGGSSPRKFPWGDAEPTGKHLNACGLECVAHVRPPGAAAQPPFLPGFEDGSRDTAPVGAYPAGNTSGGISDMAGNVWEWTATEASGATGQFVIAGGGWYDRDPVRMTLAGTRSLAADARHASLGLRCVR